MRTRVCTDLEVVNSPTISFRHIINGSAGKMSRHISRSVFVVQSPDSWNLHRRIAWKILLHHHSQINDSHGKAPPLQIQAISVHPNFSVLRRASY